MDIIRVPAGTEMTPGLLADVVTEHKHMVRERFEKLDRAYKNKYDIFDYSITPKKPDYKPDNRISVNYAKYISDTFNGFFCGIPIKATADDETLASWLEMLSAYNCLDDHNAELAKLSSNMGRAYEMYYTDEQAQLCVTHLSPMGAFMVYDDSVLNRPMFFVRYYLDSDNVERGSWSDAYVVQHFVNQGSYKWDGEAVPHYFGGVPATEFVENEERMGTYEPAMSAINAYNKALSEKANDVDYFGDSYLKILGAKVENDDIPFIRSNRVINFTGDSEGNSVEVDFLSKPDADSSQEHLLDRLDRQIFQMCMIANISDESFGSDSGIALRYKLSAMQNLAKVKERKFTGAMQRRYMLLCSHPLAASYGIHDDDWTHINFTFTMNYPANISDEADIATKLEGVVSKETQLKVLSFVDNPKAEIDRMDKELESQQINLLGDRYGSEDKAE